MVSVASVRAERPDGTSAPSQEKPPLGTQGRFLPVREQLDHCAQDVSFTSEHLFSFSGLWWDLHCSES
jgi:hypothetical protein